MTKATSKPYGYKILIPPDRTLRDDRMCHQVTKELGTRRGNNERPTRPIYHNALENTTHKHHESKV